MDQAGPAEGGFNGFFLWTNTRTDPKHVSPGKEMFLQINTVNGIAVDPSVSRGATAPAPTGQAISKFFYASDEAIRPCLGLPA